MKRGRRPAVVAVEVSAGGVRLCDGVVSVGCVVVRGCAMLGGRASRRVVVVACPAKANGCAV